MARRPHGAIYGLLAASLALNLVGAGYLGYVSLRPKPPRTVGSTIDFVSGRFPDAVGAAIREKLEARRPELSQALAEMKEARRATRDAMAAAPLDRARVEDAFALSRRKTEAFQKVVHGAIMDALPDVPPGDLAKIDRSDGE